MWSARMQLFNTNKHEDSTLIKRTEPAATDRTQRSITYTAWRIFVFHPNRTTTHIIMMVTPFTILIMNTDRQAIKYQIPSTHVLGEEFNLHYAEI
jgi:hypothetical protein